MNVQGTAHDTLVVIHYKIIKYFGAKHYVRVRGTEKPFGV